MMRLSRAMAKRPRLEQSGSSSSFFPLEDLSALDEEFELTAHKIVSGFNLQQKSRLHLLLEKSLSRDFLSLLPPEIGFKILGYLDVEDLLHGLKVCRKWRQLIIEATPAWKAAAAKKHGPSYLLAEEHRFRLPVPIYDLLKGEIETDIQEKPHLFHPQTRITWKTCADLPRNMNRGQSVVIGDKVYVTDYHVVFSYSLSGDVWNSLPDCPVTQFGMGQLEGRVVAIGGIGRSDFVMTNKVYVLDENSQSWKDSIIPPMTTPRYEPAVLSHHSSLIVTGGINQNSVVELFWRDTSQWYQICPLPFPFVYNMSSVVIQNTAYLLNGYEAADTPESNRVVYASVDSLLQKSLPPDQTSEDSDSVWKTLPNTPWYESAVATISGCLLAVGGGKKVYIYSPSTRAWLHVSDLPSPQCATTTAMISPTEFLVIGGRDVFKASLETH